MILIQVVYLLVVILSHSSMISSFSVIAFNYHISGSIIIFLLIHHENTTMSILLGYQMVALFHH